LHHQRYGHSGCHGRRQQYLTQACVQLLLLPLLQDGALPRPGTAAGCAAAFCSSSQHCVYIAALAARAAAATTEQLLQLQRAGYHKFWLRANKWLLGQFWQDEENIWMDIW
jgi:hypothetical protein